MRFSLSLSLSLNWPLVSVHRKFGLGICGFSWGEIFPTASVLFGWVCILMSVPPKEIGSTPSSIFIQHLHHLEIGSLWVALVYEFFV